jgi:hypothetical protein
MNKIHPIEAEELMAYLDGELSSHRAAATAAHLSECQGCQSLVAELRRVSQALKTWDVESADSPVPPALAVALGEHRGKPGMTHVFRPTWRDVIRRRWQSAAWIGAFAAMVLFAYVGSMSFRQKKVASFETIAAPRAQDGHQGYESAPVAPPPAPVPAAGQAQTKQFDRLEVLAQLRTPLDKKIRASSPDANVPTASGPMIIRTADLTLVTKEFDKARALIESTLKRHRGYIGEMKVGGSTGSGRTLTATLRVPSDQLDAALADLKTLGRVESESQSGQDVTSQYVDLQARLANARNTEQRLTDLLRNRTGKLSDVLEVEQEVDRVRGEIEQMEAERKNMSNQVSFATLNATISEDYKAQLQVVPPSTSTRLSNAAVEGYKSMVDGLVGLALFMLENGPTLFLWGAVLFFPARLVWKKFRRSLAQQ